MNILKIGGPSPTLTSFYTEAEEERRKKSKGKERQKSCRENFDEHDKNNAKAEKMCSGKTLVDDSPRKLQKQTKLIESWNLPRFKPEVLAYEGQISRLLRVIINRYSLVFILCILYVTLFQTLYISSVNNCRFSLKEMYKFINTTEILHLRLNDLNNAIEYANIFSLGACNASLESLNYSLQGAYSIFNQSFSKATLLSATLEKDITSANNAWFHTNLASNASTLQTDLNNITKTLNELADLLTTSSNVYSTVSIGDVANLSLSKILDLEAPTPTTVSLEPAITKFEGLYANSSENIKTLIWDASARIQEIDFGSNITFYFNSSVGALPEDELYSTLTNQATSGGRKMSVLLAVCALSSAVPFIFVEILGWQQLVNLAHTSQEFAYSPDALYMIIQAIRPVASILGYKVSLLFRQEKMRILVRWFTFYVFNSESLFLLAISMLGFLLVICQRVIIGSVAIVENLTSSSNSINAWVYSVNTMINTTETAFNHEVNKVMGDVIKNVGHQIGVQNVVWNNAFANLGLPALNMTMASPSIAMALVKYPRLTKFSTTIEDIKSAAIVDLHNSFNNFTESMCRVSAVLFGLWGIQVILGLSFVFAKNMKLV